MGRLRAGGQRHQADAGEGEQRVPEVVQGARRHALQEGLAVLCAVCSNRKIGGSFEIDLCSD